MEQSRLHPEAPEALGRGAGQLRPGPGAGEPGYAEALFNLAPVLSESDRVEEGFAIYTRHAERVYGGPGGAVPSEGPVPAHKIRHDLEQRDYLAGGKAGDGDPAVDTIFRLADDGRLATPAVDPGVAAGGAAQRWAQSRPQILVIDNLLTDEALEKIRRFCLGSTLWRQVHTKGYLGAMPEHGFASPLLAQIADELRAALPTILGPHPLSYLWAFKYDSTLVGIEVHADQAAVNVNFWITRDEANLDLQSGGLVVWDVAAPPDWDFDTSNLQSGGDPRFPGAVRRTLDDHPLQSEPGSDFRLRPVPPNRQHRVQGRLSEPADQRDHALWLADLGPVTRKPQRASIARPHRCR